MNGQNSLKSIASVFNIWCMLNVCYLSPSTTTVVPSPTSDYDNTVMYSVVAVFSHTIFHFLSPGTTTVVVPSPTGDTYCLVDVLGIV